MMRSRGLATVGRWPTPPSPSLVTLAAWNEPDPDRIRSHLAASVAADVVFADPANHTTGIDELEALIREARRDLPTAEYRQVTGVDGGHDRRYRYRWEVWIDGERFIEGMDCTTVDDQGLITRLDGFFGDFPPLPV